MPHVAIKMYPADSEEQKVKLAEEITKVIMSITGKPEAAVSIKIDEVSEDKWMDDVYNKEILPNIDDLYKKPGY
ncbi:4-oxalocrotonate tautomerase [Sphingobacterium sp. ML3W]|uniref:tautomerase family protein n=1 Tax=Sphingobacterium sp. ML3W TaxID=1538644 RepID=UPI0004F85239|nr:tautomerase family protein [Sphingobacterium sp. ML3W]AIM37023.1 4-oxalocrotonate tautomerase [Sphingobacterium sp. ML3W]